MPASSPGSTASPDAVGPTNGDLRDEAYAGLEPVAVGERVFATKGCNACHTFDGKDRVGPALNGLWGTSVQLADNTTVVFDEAYVRESILDADAKIRAGFPPGTQPSYEGQLTKRELAGLIAFIKSKT